MSIKLFNNKWNVCCHKIPRKEVIHPIPTPALLAQKENKETHFHKEGLVLSDIKDHNTPLLC